jgi:hypothetical protein
MNTYNQGIPESCIIIRLYQFFRIPVSRVPFVQDILVTYFRGMSKINQVVFIGQRSLFVKFTGIQSPLIPEACGPQ